MPPAILALSEPKSATLIPSTLTADMRKYVSAQKMLTSKNGAVSGLLDKFKHFQSELAVTVQGASCCHSTAMAAARNAVMSRPVHSLWARTAGPLDGVTSLGKGAPLPAQRAWPTNRQCTLKAYEFIKQPTSHRNKSCLSI